MPTVHNFNLGRVLPIFKGTYSSTANYVPLDIVYYNGSSYVCKQNAQNVLPTNTSYWQIVALKGELSPTLLPAQVEAIIQQIESESNFVIDANYVHTDNNFSTTYKDAIDGLPEAIGDATITIQRNGVNVGTFTTNSTANKTINLQVPTQISDLSGDDTFLKMPIVISNSTDDSINIPTLKQGVVYYYSTPVKAILINGLEYNDVRDSYKLQPTYIDFVTGESISDIKIPNLLYCDFDPQKIREYIVPNAIYRMKIEHNILTITRLYKQS